MNISVEAHQIITTRSTCFSSRKRLMSARIASSIARLSTDACTLPASMFLTYVRSNAAAIGRTSRRASEICSMCLPPLEHAGALGGDVGVVGERVPRAEHDVVERGERHEVPDQRAAVVGALAEADRVHQGQRADRLGEAALDELDAGDQRRGDGAEADGEDAEAAVGWRNVGSRWRRHVREARSSPTGHRAMGPRAPRVATARAGGA